MSVLCYLISIVLYVHVVAAESSCRTPSGGKGKCESVHTCDEFLGLVKNMNGSLQELVELLRNSTCDQKYAMVCCPVQCYTPEGRTGTCVSIYSCQHLLDMVRLPLSQEVKNLILSHKCDGPDQYSVCCASNNTTNSNNSPEVSPNSYNYNAVCATKQTAMPPEPNSECCGYDSTVPNLIVGGVPTSIDQYPWLALIQYERINPGNLFLCGGSLISGKYVLTAAHCISYYTIKNIGIPKLVRLGEYDTANEGQDCTIVEGGNSDCTEGDVRIDIEKYIPHPEYNPLSKKNDIGLLRLKRMAPFTDFIRPICLPTYDITVNKPMSGKFYMYAAGWGANDERTINTIKLHVYLPYVELDDCQTAFLKSDIKVQLWNRQLCAGGESGKDSCKGDSGGPLMYESRSKFHVHGVVNFGLTPCAQPDKPGVYAKVFAYKNWILNTITHDINTSN